MIDGWTVVDVRVCVWYYKTENLPRRIFGLNRFTVLTNGFINVFYGYDINTIYKLAWSGLGIHQLQSWRLFMANAKRLGSFFIRLGHSYSLSEVAQKYAEFRQE